MSDQGTLVARVYTSNAMLPVEGAAVAVTRPRPDGRYELLALRITNFDGVTDPISLPAPAANGVTLAQDVQTPYSLVTLTAHQPGYDRVVVENVQIFSGIQTVQDLMLIPTPRLPKQYDRTETFVIPDQNL